jgi:nitroreductase
MPEKNWKEMEDLDMMKKLAMTRRSTRIFRSDPVHISDILEVIEAGTYAPSGANTQPWRFIIIDDATVKRSIREGAEKADQKFHREAPEWLKKWLKDNKITPEKRFLTEAPFLIVVVALTTMPYWLESTWTSIAYVILTAEEKGLSSLTYTPGETDFLNSLLDIPKDYNVVAILPLGFSNKKRLPKPRRKNITQLVFRNKFGKEMF